MRKALLTFGYGSMSGVLDLTLPRMRKYAEKWGYDLIVPSRPEFADAPASWDKIRKIEPIATSCPVEEPLGYDRVLWLDADVVVTDASTDVSDFFAHGENAIGMVVHHNEVHGHTPNCGVMAIHGYPSALALLFRRSTVVCSGVAGRHKWSSIWEQGTMWELLGLGDQEFPLKRPDLWPEWFHELDYRWNAAPIDDRGLVSDARFVHFCGERDHEVLRARIERFISDNPMRGL